MLNTLSIRYYAMLCMNPGMCVRVVRVCVCVLVRFRKREMIIMRIARAQRQAGDDRTRKRRNMQQHSASDCCCVAARCGNDIVIKVQTRASTRVFCIQHIHNIRTYIYTHKYTYRAVFML